VLKTSSEKEWKFASVPDADHSKQYTWSSVKEDTVQDVLINTLKTYSTRKKQNKKMDERAKYKTGELFYEVSFDVPRKKPDIRGIKNEKEIEAIVEGIHKQFPEASNIIVIPCNMYKTSPCLSVSKDDYSHSIYYAKEKNQLLK
jgi:hypothetical protein